MLSWTATSAWNPRRTPHHRGKTCCWRVSLSILSAAAAPNAVFLSASAASRLDWTAYASTEARFRRRIKLDVLLYYQELILDRAMAENSSRLPRELWRRRSGELPLRRRWNSCSGGIRMRLSGREGRVRISWGFVLILLIFFHFYRKQCCFSNLLGRLTFILSFILSWQTNILGRLAFILRRSEFPLSRSKDAPTRRNY